MKKYRAIFTFDASTDLEIEANSLEEAKRIAEKTSFASPLCNQCTKDIQVGRIIEEKNEAGYAYYTKSGTIAYREWQNERR